MRVGRVAVESVLRERAVVVGAAMSFDDFVRDNQVALVRYATLLSGSRAHGEDLVQDVLVRIYPRWDGLTRGPGSIGAYVRRAITNEHVYWRRRWSTRHIHLVDGDELPDTPVDGLNERDEQLWARLLVPPSRQRAAVVLRYYEGLADGEIAEVLACRQATVRSHISRGLAALRSDGLRDEVDR